MQRFIPVKGVKHLRYVYLSGFLSLKCLFNQSSISGQVMPQCVFHIKEEGDVTSF
jgi:hypothetical protein